MRVALRATRWLVQAIRSLWSQFGRPWHRNENSSGSIPPFFIQHGVSMKAGSDFLIEGGVREHIALPVVRS